METTKDTHADAEKMLDCNIWIYKSRLSGSVHKLYRLKVLFTLEKVNTSVVEKKKSLNEQNFDVEDLELRYQICYKPFHLKNLFLKWLTILQNKIKSESRARRKLMSKVSSFSHLRCYFWFTLQAQQFNNSTFLAFSYISNKRFYKHDHFWTL